MSASPREDRRDQLGDVAAVVLVVGVGVDDHVGAELERRVEAGLEARTRGPCCWSGARCGRRRARGRPRPCGRWSRRRSRATRPSSKPGDLARQVGQRDRERLLLVQAGDLDDELHAAGMRHSTGRHGRRMESAIAHATGRAAAAGGAAARRARCARWAARRASRARASRRSSGSSSIPPTPTTTPTTRCCGAGSSCTAPAALRGLPRADRAPARDRSSARCSRCSGRDADRVLVGSRSRRFVALVAGHLPARARRLHAVGRRRRGAADADALRLPLPGRARLHRHPVHGARRVGGGARGRAAAARARRCSLLLAAAGLMRPEAWLLIGLYFLWMSWRRDLARARCATRRWPRSARSLWMRGRRRR